jgi:hypothetical protein
MGHGAGWLVENAGGGSLAVFQGSFLSARDITFLLRFVFVVLYLTKVYYTSYDRSSLIGILKCC